MTPSISPSNHFEFVIIGGGTACICLSATYYPFSTGMAC